MISLGRNPGCWSNKCTSRTSMLAGNAAKSAALMDWGRWDAATGQYDRQSPTSCRDGDAHDVYETRHRHLLNAPAPNPHTCHAESATTTSSGWRVTAVVPISIHSWRGHLPGLLQLSHKTTPPLCQRKATPDQLIAVLRIAWLAEVSLIVTVVLSYAFTRRPHHRCSGFTSACRASQFAWTRVSTLTGASVCGLCCRLRYRLRNLLSAAANQAMTRFTALLKLCPNRGLETSMPTTIGVYSVWR